MKQESVLMQKGKILLKTTDCEDTGCMHKSMNIMQEL